MNLRSFLYINPTLLDDYISAIDGFVYEEETLTTSKTKSVEGGLEGGIPVVKGKGNYTNTDTEEAQKQVRITNSAKFDKVYNYLEEQDNLKYYEYMEDAQWDEIRRNDFLEVLVTPRFSKLKEIANLGQNIGNLLDTFQSLTDEPVIDKKSKEAINGIASLSKIKKGNEIPCVFNLSNEKFPIVAYLDEQNFKVNQNRFVGQVYMLCKVQRKLEKGEKIQLDEIFEDVKKLPLNREQRRSLPKDTSNPKGLKDEIKGRAFVVIPIAIYQ